MTPCQADLAQRRDVAEATGEAMVPTPYDVLIDEPVGRRFLIAQAEARALCRECPVRNACLAEHADEPWSNAIRRRWRDGRNESRDIRNWAAENGLEVRPTGRIPTTVIDAYRVAIQEAS